MSHLSKHGTNFIDIRYGMSALISHYCCMNLIFFAYRCIVTPVLYQNEIQLHQNLDCCLLDINTVYSYRGY